MFLRLKTMKRLIFSLLTLLLPYSVWAAKPRVELAMPYYEGYTNPNGTGIYWDIFRNIYEKHGYTVNTINLPYARATFLLKNAKTDVVTGAYFKEFNNVLFPKRELSFDIDIVSAVYLKSSSLKIVNVNDLIDKRVGWPHGYRYELYLPKIKKSSKLTGGIYAINMLKKNRLDYYLDSNTEIEQIINKIDPNREVYGIQDILQIHLYPAFPDTKKGWELLKIYESEIKILQESGKLKMYYEKYGAKYLK